MLWRPSARAKKSPELKLYTLAKRYGAQLAVAGAAAFALVPEHAAIDASEDVAIQHLVGAVGLVDALDINVLQRFAGLDVIESDALALSPMSECVGNELRDFRPM